MKVALVYDRINKYGGAERVLQALHEIWPDAPIYTAVYDQKGAFWADSYDIRPSFLNNIPYARSNHEFLPLLTPIAFESFNFDDFDIVISVSSSDAKNIITKPDTLHICYCLTPARYLWSGETDYENIPGPGYVRLFSNIVFMKAKNILKKWDLISSGRPDRYIAISNTVKDRIENTYRRYVDKIIYPPVDTGLFRPLGKDEKPIIKLPFPKYSYMLCVSRFVYYKRIDVVIDACEKSKIPLVVIGSGRERENLLKHKGDYTVFIEDKLTDEELCHYYNFCRAFIYAGYEDFGLAVAEAQSAGCPVIGLSSGGTAEIVKNGKTGILVDSLTADGFEKAIRKFQDSDIKSEDCRKNALQFGKDRFKAEFFNFVVKSYTQNHL